MKKILSILLSILMIFAFGAISVSADENLDVSFDLEMQTGASIRLGNETGIRFYTKLTDDDIQRISALRNAGYKVELGTMIAPADVIPGEYVAGTTYKANLSLGSTGALTLDTVMNGYMKNYKNVVVPVARTYAVVEFKATDYYYEGEFKGFVGSIVNIKKGYEHSNYDTTQITSYSKDSGNITRNFIGRGYIKVTDLEGNETISYAAYVNDAVSNHSRSLKTVAGALKNDTTQSALYAQYKAIIDDWASASKIEYSPIY